MVAAIPLLPVHTRDMRFIEDGNPTWICQNSMINVDKMKMFASSVAMLLRFQGTFYRDDLCCVAIGQWLRYSQYWATRYEELD